MADDKAVALGPPESIGEHLVRDATERGVEVLRAVASVASFPRTAEAQCPSSRRTTGSEPDQESCTAA